MIIRTLKAEGPPGVFAAMSITAAFALAGCGDYDARTTGPADEGIDSIAEEWSVASCSGGPPHKEYQGILSPAYLTSASYNKCDRSAVFDVVRLQDVDYPQDVELVWADQVSTAPAQCARLAGRDGDFLWGGVIVYHRDNEYQAWEHLGTYEDYGDWKYQGQCFNYVGTTNAPCCTAPVIRVPLPLTGDVRFAASFRQYTSPSTAGVTKRLRIGTYPSR